MSKQKKPNQKTKTTKQHAKAATNQSGYVSYGATADDIVSISQAADVLGVSIDTVRRWDKQGILHSSRPDGKNRYFAVEELEKVKFAQPLSISEAAEQLNVSPSTLRRLEKKGLISPSRDEQGNRTYDRKTLERFLHSEYFVRQKEVEEQVLAPLTHKEGEEEDETDKAHHDPATHAILGEHHLHISSLKRFKKIFLVSLTALVGSFILLVSLLTLLFFLFPESTAKSLGYFKQIPTSKQYVFQTPDSLLARQLKPFSQAALRVVEVVNPELRKKVAPFPAIEDVNDVLAPDTEGNITSLYTFTVPDTSYLRIPDKGLVVNLNSDYLRGRVPGEEPGDLAILPIDTDHIADGAITEEKLSPGLSLGGGGTTVVNATTTTSDDGGGGGGGGDGDITAVNAGDGLHGGGTDGSVTLNVGEGHGIVVSSSSIALNVHDTGPGLQVNANGLSLLRSCLSGQILKWNGSGWVCGADQGAAGAAITVEEGDVTIGTDISTLDFLGSDFNVNQAPAGEANVSLDYVNSGITRRDEDENISGSWTFSSGTPISFSHASPTLAMINGGTLAFTDNINTLMTLTDAGTTGNLSLTGDLEVLGNDITFGNGESISNTTDGTITFGRNDAGTVTLTAKDDDSNSALTLLPGGAAALTLGGALTTNITLVTDGTGDGEVVLPDGSIGSLEILDNSILEADLKAVNAPTDEQCLTYEATGGDFEWQACGGGGGGSTAWSDLTAPAANLNLNHNEFATVFDWDTADTAGSFDGLTLAITNDATLDTAVQRVLTVRNNNATGGLTETLIRVENADDSTVGTGVEVVSTGGGFITNAFDASDGEIVNALNIGPNRILGTIGTIDFDNFDVASTGTVTIAAGQAYTGVDQVVFSSGGGGDVVVNSSSGEVRFGDGDVLHVGGLNSDALTYNALSNAGGAASNPAISSDNDLYIQGDLEIDGSFTLDSSVLNCDNCIDWDDISDAMTLDATTTSSLGANTFTWILDGAGNYVTNLASSGDFLIQDAGATFLTIDDTGGYSYTLDATDNPAYTITNNGSGAVTTELAGSGSQVFNLSSTGDFLIQDGGVTTAAFDDTGGITFTPTAGSDFVINQTTGTNTQITATAAPTVDIMSISNSAFGTATNGVSGISLDFTTAAVAGVRDNAALDIQVSSGATEASDVLQAINIGNLAGGAGTESAIQIGTGWDRDLNFVDTTPSIVLADGAGSFITFEDSTGTDMLILRDIDSTGHHTLFGDADTGLEISGATTDITTPAGEALTIESGTTGTINIGTDGSAESINLGTGPAAKTLTIGSSSTTSSTLIQSGSGDITLNSTGAGAGNIILADTDTFAIGGVASGLAYNAISNAGGAASNPAISSDNDLYIQGDLEVDGSFTLDSSVLNCDNCIDWDDISDAMTLDATTTSSLGANTFTWILDGAGNYVTNLASSGDFLIQDAGVNFAQFLDDGTVTLGKASAPSTINIGVGSAADTIHIGDGTTTADTITIGNNVAGTTLSLDAGSGASSLQIGNSATPHDIRIGNGGTSAQTVTIGSTSSTSTTTINAGSGDITLNAGAGAGNIILADTDTFAIGGVAAGLAYNALSNAGGVANGGDVADDNDLYIQGALEVDGNFNLGGDLTILGTTFTANNVTTFNCSNCIDWDDISDAMTLDATTTSSLGANTFTWILDGAGNYVTNLASSGDFLIQDAGATFLTIDDTGGYSYTLDATDNPAYTITNNGSGAVTTELAGSGSQVFNLSSTGDFLIQDGGVTTAAFDDTGGITFTPSSGSDFVINQATGTNTQIAATAAPTVDIMSISNSGLGTVTDGVDGLEITFEQAAVAGVRDNAALRVSVTSGASEAGDTLEGIDIATLVGASAGVETALRVGGGWDTGLRFNSNTITTDIVLQNGETIDNDLDGTILFTSPTIQTSGIMLVGDGAGNDYLSFTEEATNPACAPGEYKIWANSTEDLLKKCQNGALSDLDAAGAWNQLTPPTGDLVMDHQAFVTTFDWTTTAALDPWTFGLTNDGASGTQRAVSIIQRESTGSDATDALLWLDNADTSASGSTIVNDGLLVTVSGGLADGITDAIDVSDANILNALNVGANNITGTTASIDFTNFDVAGDGSFTFNNNSATDSIISLASTGDLLVRDNGTAFATFDDAGGITFAPTAGSDFIINQAAGTNTQIAATAAPTVDMFTVSNSGQGTITDGVDGASISYAQASDAANITGSALDISVTASGDAGDTIKGININSVTGTSSTETAIQVGTGWDVGLKIGDSGTVPTRPAGETTRTVDVTGNWGGNVVKNEQTADCNDVDVVIDEKALVYHLESNFDSGLTASCTFDITGLPNTEGTYAFIFSSADNSGVGTSETVVEINDQQVGAISGGTETYTVVRTDGVWEVIGQPGNSNADLAEWTQFAGEKPQPAELVSMGSDPQRVERTSSAYDNKLVGIVSTSPHTTMGQETEDSIRLALAGRVPTKVTTENGPIKQGDYITSSSTPGAGMRATKAGYVVGIAMEDFAGEGIGSVMTLVNTHWYGGDSDAFWSDGLVSLDGTEVLDRLTTDNQAGLEDKALSNIMTDRLVAGLEIVTPKLTADRIQTNTIAPASGTDVNVELSDGGGLTINNQDGREVARFDDAGNASFAGRVEADETYANQVVGTDIGERFYTNDDSITYGDVVAVDQSLRHGARRSGSAYDKQLLGVVSTVPSLMVEDKDGDGKPLVVAVSGTVSVKVNSESGVIHAGDPLTSSSTPGVAMKATKEGPIIGRALNDFAGKSGTVLARVDNGYSAGAIREEIDNLDNRVGSLESDVEGLKSTDSTSSDDQQLLENLQVSTLSVELDLDVGGALTVAGPANFYGQTVFHKLVTFVERTVFGNDVVFEGRPTFNEDTAGFARVRAGEQKVKVTFTEEYAELPVVSVTLGEGEFASYSYDNLTTRGFEIVLEEPAARDLDFSWIALSIDNAQTHVNAARQ